MLGVAVSQGVFAGFFGPIYQRGDIVHPEGHPQWCVVVYQFDRCTNLYAYRDYTLILGRYRLDDEMKYEEKERFEKYYNVVFARNSLPFVEEIERRNP